MKFQTLTSTTMVPSVSMLKAQASARASPTPRFCDTRASEQEQVSAPLYYPQHRTPRCTQLQLSNCFDSDTQSEHGGIHHHWRHEGHTHVQKQIMWLVSKPGYFPPSILQLNVVNQLSQRCIMGGNNRFPVEEVSTRVCTGIACDLNQDYASPDPPWCGWVANGIGRVSLRWSGCRALGKICCNGGLMQTECTKVSS